MSLHFDVFMFILHNPCATSRTKILINYIKSLCFLKWRAAIYKLWARVTCTYDDFFCIAINFPISLCNHLYLTLVQLKFNSGTHLAGWSVKKSSDMKTR